MANKSDDTVGGRYHRLDLKADPNGEARIDPDETGQSGFIHSFETAGTLDGPGIRFVVFMTGCPLRCQYCQNPDTWHVRNGSPMSVDQVMREIEKYADFLIKGGGGVTFSGGEPLVQIKFLANLLQRCKQRGLHTAVDTSGVLGERVTDAMLVDTDLVLLDIKAFDPGIYRKVTAGKAASTQAFAKRLSTLAKPTWIRFVLVPQLTDDYEDIEHLADFVAALQSVERVEVLPFHKMGEHKWEALYLDYQLKETAPPSDELIARVQDQFRKRDLTVL
jgi:pyruvate formate lyase activating enzyme